MTIRNAIPDVSELTGADYPNVVSITADETYWQEQTPAQLMWGYFCLEIIRQFEQRLLEQEITELVHGPIHSSIGQEAVAVGTALALTSDDKVTSTHRAHHHFLAKAIAHYAPPQEEFKSYRDNSDLRDCVRRTMAEIMGLDVGWVGGRGGSMHLFDDQSGNIGTQAIVAGNVPYAAGIAFAEKFRDSGHVAVSFLGDGAVSIGPFHEGLCMAKVYHLPAIFVVENNLYGVATSVNEATQLNDLALRSSGYNIPGLIVDGMNPLAVKRAIQLAKAYAITSGPVLIEAKTYRYFHQAGGMPGSAFGYRSKDEEKAWRDRDPLTSAPWVLVHRGLFSEEDVMCVKEIATAFVDDAIDYCTELNDQDDLQLRQEFVPDAAAATLYVRSDGAEFSSAEFSEEQDFTETEIVKIVQAKSEVIGRHMERNPEVFTLGEDVANMKGGAYGATRKALTEAPERVLNAPIAEGGIVGIAHGAAVMGMRPIAEIMFSDFSLIAADELFNQVATCRYMYNNRVDVPLVIRSRCSAGRGYGAQHSGDTVGQFALYPGIRIVAPTTPFDYIGLFNSAMQSLDPVLMLEHHEIDLLAGAVPVDERDFLVAFGKAARRRTGSDLTIATYLSMVPRVLRMADELAEESGLDIEVIDLRSLDYASIDFDTLASSISKTGQLAIVEQAMETQCLGPFIAAKLREYLPSDFTPPVQLINSAPVPMPVSFPLERAVLLSDEKIRQQLLSCCQAATTRS